MSAAGPPWPRPGTHSVPLVVLFLLVSAGRVDAQVFETVGVRALGMGGAFVAVADDATAIYWNPAGLTDVFFSGVLDVQRTDTRLDPDPLRREGTSEFTTLAAIATPTRGLSYYRLRSWQVDRVSGDAGAEHATASLTSLVTHHAGVTLVQRFAPGLTIATVLKAVHGTVAVGTGTGTTPIRELFAQASELAGRSTIQLDLDVGVMIGVGAIKVALVGRNLREPEFAAADDVAASLERQFRAGLAVHPTGSLVVAVDVDLGSTDTAAGPRRAVAVGTEQRIGWLIVRAGGRVNLEDDRPEPIATIGLSLEILSGVWLDGQVSGGRDNGDRGWGVSARVGVL